MTQTHLFKAVKYLVPRDVKRKRIRITSYSRGLRSLEHVENKSVNVLKITMGKYNTQDTQLYYVPGDSSSTGTATIDYIY